MALNPAPPPTIRNLMWPPVSTRGGPAKRDTPCHEHGLRVALAERAGVAHVAAQFEVDLTEADFGVHVQQWPRFRAPQAFAGHVLERFAECGNPVAANVQSRCLVVASEAVQMVRAGRNGAVQVEGRDRSRAPPPHLPVQGDHHRRPMDAFDHARRHDADHPRVPAFSHHHDRPVPRRVVVLPKRGERLLGGAAIQVAALDVVTIQFLRQPARLAGVLGEQQPERLPRVSHPSRRVDARADPEGYRVGFHGIPRGQVGDPHQRLQTPPSRPRQHPQAVACQDPVFALQPHHVGDRRHGHQVEVVPSPVGGLSDRACHELPDLEGNSCSAQVLVGIRAPRPVGIDHRHRGRKAPPGRVMIGDDDVHPRVHREAHRFQRRDPAVDRHQQGCSPGGGPLDTRGREVVAVPEPVGDDRLGPASKSADPMGEQRRPRDAVHVVIPVDHHHFVTFDGLHDPPRRRFGVQEKTGVVQRREERAQKGLCIRGGGVSAHCKQPTQGRRQLQAAPEVADRVRIGGRAKLPDGPRNECGVVVGSAPIHSVRSPNGLRRRRRLCAATGTRTRQRPPVRSR